jgi:tetratricopeptide (TPR) repeat protein
MICGSVGAYGVPLDVVGEREPTAAFDHNWALMGARKAKERGLLSVARSLYARALEDKGITLEVRQGVGIELAEVLIADGEYETALKVLDELPERKGAHYDLLDAVARYHRGDESKARELFARIDTHGLDVSNLHWYYLLAGILAQKDNNHSDALDLYKSAQKFAQGEDQRARVQGLIMRSEIAVEGEPSDSLAKKLKRQLIGFFKSPPPATIAKEYAVMLESLGKQEEALDALEYTINNLPHADQSERDNLNLLMGLIGGKGSTRGIEGLKAILREHRNNEVSKMALLLYLKHEMESAGMVAFLTELIEGPNERNKHPIVDVLVSVRGILLLEQNDRLGAYRDAMTVVEIYPGSAQKNAAYELLAYLSWTSSPSEYRKAADYLAKVIEGTHDWKQQKELMVLTGDCYYLNKDFGQASEIYLAAARKYESKGDIGAIVYQWVLSMLQENRVEEAGKVLDEYSGRIDSQNQWRAQWNLIRKLNEMGRRKDAYRRVNELLAKEVASMSVELQLRFMWLRAQLAFDFGDKGSVVSLVDSVLEVLQKQGPAQLNSADLKLIASQALLLKGQALLELGQEELGLKIMSQLREGYTGSKAAITSYIVESRYYARGGNRARAQQLLINLSDMYPNSDYAAMALYEAALNCEARETQSNYQEAITILERLITLYPNSELIFYARLGQGDLLRKMGKFAEAQLIYENVLTRNPEHSEIYKIILAKSDSLFAQARNDAEKLKDVALQYEELYDRKEAPIEVRIESGFKEGHAYSKAQENSRAKEVYWRVITDNLKGEAGAKDIAQKGRYWLARTLFELGGVLEEEPKAAQEAKTVYQMVIDHGLPGVDLAKAKI